MTNDSDPSDTLQRALNASAANDVENALRLLQQAGEEEPSSALPPFLLGAELAQLGKIAEAEAAYANAVLLAPEFHIARFELGTLQFTSGRAALALVTWEPLVKLPEDTAFHLFVKGYAALAQDDFSNALDKFRQGLAANTTNDALNANIRLLISRIEGIRQEPADESPAEAEHFLVSNYGRQGPLH